MIIDEFSDLVKISLVDKIVATLGSEIDLDNDNDQHKGYPRSRSSQTLLIRSLLALTLLVRYWRLLEIRKLSLYQHP